MRFPVLRAHQRFQHSSSSLRRPFFPGLRRPALDSPSLRIRGGRRRGAGDDGNGVMCYATESDGGGDVYTLKDRHTEEEVVKKSRFIAFATPLTSPEDFDGFLASVRDDTASHNCWAWKVGSDYRFSDDGEPGGTAGRPILQAIEYSGLDGVGVVVTRFFGGIKLGAGGLCRAYGGAAASCLRQAQRVKVVPMVELRVSCAADLIGIIYRALSAYQGVHTDYCEDGSVVISARLPSADASSMVEQIRGATQARAKTEVTDTQASTADVAT